MHTKEAKTAEEGQEASYRIFYAIKLTAARRDDVKTYFWNRTKQKWVGELVQTCLYSSQEKVQNEFKHKNHKRGPTRKFSVCKFKLVLHEITDDPENDWP